jgi:hypothetical protein
VTGHPTVGVPAPGDGRPIPIDVDLAPLIARLWHLEVETSSCCQQAEPGWASIEFPSQRAVLAFLEALDLGAQAALRDDGGTNIPLASL